MTHIHQIATLALMLGLGFITACTTEKSGEVGAKTIENQDALPQLSEAFQVEVDRLEGAIQSAESSVKLYHQHLSKLRKSVFEPSAFSLSTGTLSPTRNTALILLAAVPGSPSVAPNPSPSRRVMRVSRLNQQLTALCSHSPIFKRRLEAAFGLDRVQGLCPLKTHESPFKLQANQLPNLVYQAVTSRTATQRKNLLLLATSNDPRAVYPLLALPDLNAGKPSKVLYNLDALDIGLISAATHRPHRQRLETMLASPTLSPQVRSRLIFALAWHGHPAASPVVSELFEESQAHPTRSNDALMALLRRIKESTTLQQILTLEYEKPKTSSRLISILDHNQIGQDFWGTLLTQTLSHQANHAQSWRDLKNRMGLSAHVDWQAVLKANAANGGVSDLIRHLSQANHALTHAQCEAFKSKVEVLTKAHAKESLITLVHSNGCSTEQELQAAMADGSAMATLLIGETAIRPNLFFLDRLSNSTHAVASTTAQALLLKPRTVGTLKPVAAYASVLAQQLKPKVQNFYILRLLRQLIVEDASNTAQTQHGKQLIQRIEPFATGKIGAIHTDALLILESIGSPQSLQIIRSSLKALNPGQVKVKLMARFGHHLE